MNERKIKRMRVSSRAFLDLFQAGEHGAYVVENPLPEDARIVQVSYDWIGGVIELVVWSDTFDAVPDGAVIPHLGELRTTRSVQRKDPLDDWMN